MAEDSFVEAILTTIRSEANNNPSPKPCHITQVYEDGIHIDIETNDGDTIEYLKAIGKPSVDEDAVILFIDENPSNSLVIPQSLEVYSKLGLNQSEADKFNYAVISRVEDNITNIELWILANAYYDYSNKKFVKINPKSNSFGIQIQSEGNYPGETELGYLDNTSIGVWRHPKVSAIYKDTTNYDYTDLEEKGWIGCKRKSDNKWFEFGVSAGWNNNFMMDSYGGMTIGGAGFEIDGNGIYPYIRLTHSICTIDDTRYALVGLIDNAYHTLNECDSNATYSWFTGLMTPVNANNVKDNTETAFVIMYNDTTTDAEHPHTINASNWNIVFKVNKNGVIND